MKRYLAALLVVLGVLGLLGVLAVGTGFANDENAAGAHWPLRQECSKATLDGRYLVAYQGIEIRGNNQLPFAVAGYEVYNGNGKVKGVYSVNFNGKAFRNESGSGTYSVKANCTSTATFTDGTRYDQFIAPDGSKFTFVQTKPSQQVTAGLEPRATAKRVAP
jgi:hypothetical protein